MAFVYIIFQLSDILALKKGTYHKKCTIIGAMVLRTQIMTSSASEMQFLKVC